MDLVEEQVALERKRLQQLVQEHQARLDQKAGERETSLQEFMVDWALRFEDQFLQRLQQLRANIETSVGDPQLLAELAEETEEVGQWAIASYESRLKALMESGENPL